MNRVLALQGIASYQKGFGGNNVHTYYSADCPTSYASTMTVGCTSPPPRMAW